MAGVAARILGVGVEAARVDFEGPRPGARVDGVAVSIVLQDLDTTRVAACIRRVGSRTFCRVRRPARAITAAAARKAAHPASDARAASRQTPVAACVPSAATRVVSTSWTGGDTPTTVADDPARGAAARSVECCGSTQLWLPAAPTTPERPRTVGRKSGVEPPPSRAAASPAIFSRSTRQNFPGLPRRGKDFPPPSRRPAFTHPLSAVCGNNSAPVIYEWAGADAVSCSKKRSPRPGSLARHLVHHPFV